MTQRYFRDNQSARRSQELSGEWKQTTFFNHADQQELDLDLSVIDEKTPVLEFILPKLRNQKDEQA